MDRKRKFVEEEESEVQIQKVTKVEKERPAHLLPEFCDEILIQILSSLDSESLFSLQQ